MSTCPMEDATYVPTETVHDSMNLESVLGESQQHYGIERNVFVTNRIGSTMHVNFEVTDTKRAILSVHKGCGIASMIVFTPDGRCKIVSDKSCIEQVQQIMETTPEFDIVYDRGARDVNDDVYVNERQKLKVSLESVFSCRAQSAIGTSLETSTAGS